MTPLSEAFRRTVLGVHGANGDRWLAGFDALLRYCERRWKLAIGEPYPLSFNFVAPADGPGGEAYVLKLGVPEDPERPLETAALRLLGGRGAVRVVDAEPEKGILLLERCSPGRTLHAVADDAEAAAIAAALIRKLRTPAPAGGGFPTTQRWALGLRRLRDRFGGGTGPLPERLVRLAETGLARLHASAAEPCLLHGDLHHGNILSAEREPWLAVDPKGVIGELAFEPVPFLLNNWPDGAGEEALVRLAVERAERFADALGLEARRILAWTLCHSVLSECWGIEDGTSSPEQPLLAAGLARWFAERGDNEWIAEE